MEQLRYTWSFGAWYGAWCTSFCTVIARLESQEFFRGFLKGGGVTSVQEKNSELKYGDIAGHPLPHSIVKHWQDPLKPHVVSMSTHWSKSDLCVLTIRSRARCYEYKNKKKTHKKPWVWVSDRISIHWSFWICPFDCIIEEKPAI